eukprot:2855851-Prymnesium_polylepis.1
MLRTNSWRFQQDGAGIHSVAATLKGRKRGAPLSSESAPNLLEPWPARSPDLSPIEHTWVAAVEKLHEQEWHDFESFKLAVHCAWELTTTPAYCRKLLGGRQNVTGSPLDEARGGRFRR